MIAAYIDNNLNPVGERLLLNTATTQRRTDYDFSHENSTRCCASSSRRAAGADMYLFDTAGNVIYTVQKDIDFATDNADGAPMRRWPGRLRRALEVTTTGEVVFEDFAPYAALGDAPASFLGNAPSSTCAAASPGRHGDPHRADCDRRHDGRAGRDAGRDRRVLHRRRRRASAQRFRRPGPTRCGQPIATGWSTARWRALASGGLDHRPRRADAWDAAPMESTRRWAVVTTHGRARSTRWPTATGAMILWVGGLLADGADHRHSLLTAADAADLAHGR